MRAIDSELGHVILWLKDQQKVGVASIQRQFGFSYNKSLALFNRLKEEGLLLPGITKSVWMVRRSDDA